MNGNAEFVFCADFAKGLTAEVVTAKCNFFRQFQGWGITSLFIFFMRFILYSDVIQFRKNV
jgi:hypothetical protein